MRHFFKTAAVFSLCAALASCSGNTVQNVSNDESSETETQASTTESRQDTKIVLGYYGSIPSAMQKALEDFNAEDDGYIVELNDYHLIREPIPPGIEGDELHELSDKIEKKYREYVFSDIRSCGSDIITDVLKPADIDHLKNEGVYADLCEFAGEGDLAAYNEHILGMCRTDGKLYEIPYNYQLQTLIGSREYLGDRTSWTIDDVVEIYDSLPEGTLLNYTENRGLIANMFISNCCIYIDMVNGKRELRADELRRVLQFCMRFSNDKYSSRNGTTYLLSYIDGAFGFNDYCSFIKKFKDVNGDFTIIGFPSEKGYSASVEVNRALSINSASPDEVKKGAWEFIKYVTSEDKQAELNQGFPINNADFKLQGNEKIKAGSLTQQEYDELCRCINGAVLYDKLQERELFNTLSEYYSSALAENISIDQSIENIRGNI